MIASRAPRAAAAPQREQNLPTPPVFSDSEHKRHRARMGAAHDPLRAQRVRSVPSPLPSLAADDCGGVLYQGTDVPPNQRIHERDREGGAPSITSHPMWESITSLMHHTAEALESGDALGRYLRPSAETDFMGWRFVDDVTVKEAPKRYGKFGRPIDDL